MSRTLHIALVTMLCLALVACGDEPPRVPPVEARSSALAMPAGSWAPQAPFDEVRLSPFAPMR